MKTHGARRVESHEAGQIPEAERLHALRAIAESNARWVERLEGLVRQLDTFYGGMVFDPKLDDAEVRRQARFYFKCLVRLFRLIRVAQDRYLLAMGINLVPVKTSGKRSEAPPIQPKPESTEACNPVVRTLTQAIQAKMDERRRGAAAATSPATKEQEDNHGRNPLFSTLKQ